MRPASLSDNKSPKELSESACSPARVTKCCTIRSRSSVSTGTSNLGPGPQKHLTVMPRIRTERSPVRATGLPPTRRLLAGDSILAWSESLSLPKIAARPFGPPWLEAGVPAGSDKASLELPPPLATSSRPAIPYKIVYRCMKWRTMHLTRQQHVKPRMSTADTNALVAHVSDRFQHHPSLPSASPNTFHRCNLHGQSLPADIATQLPTSGSHRLRPLSQSTPALGPQ